MLPAGRVPIRRQSELSAIEGVLDPMLMPGVLETLDGEATGKVIATLQSSTEDTATVEVNVDVEFSSDQAGSLEELIRAHAPMGVTLELETASFTSSLRGKGTLVWNTERNLPRSFALSLKTTLRMEIAVRLDDPGENELFKMNESQARTLRLGMQLSDR